MAKSLKTIALIILLFTAAIVGALVNNMLSVRRENRNAHLRAIEEARESVLKLKVALKTGVTEEEYESLHKDVIFSFFKSEATKPFQARATDLDKIMYATEYFWHLTKQELDDGLWPGTPDENFREQARIVVWPAEPAKLMPKHYEATADLPAHWTRPTVYMKFGIDTTSLAADILLEEIDNPDKKIDNAQHL